jgi:hypothetical protein
MPIKHPNRVELSEQGYNLIHVGFGAQYWAHGNLFLEQTTENV